MALAPETATDDSIPRALALVREHSKSSRTKKSHGKRRSRTKTAEEKPAYRGIGDSKCIPTRVLLLTVITYPVLGGPAKITILKALYKDRQQKFQKLLSGAVQ